MISLQSSYAKVSLQVSQTVHYIQLTDRKRSNKVSEMNLIRSYNNWRRYRDTVTELSRLSARELNDLGISRGDIAFVAKKAASAQ